MDFRSSTTRCLAVLAFAFVLCLFAACGGGANVDQQAFDKIQNGMSGEQVINILGYTDIVHDNEHADSQYMGVWKNGNKEIKVVFVNDKVYNKSKKGF